MNEKKNVLFKELDKDEISSFHDESLLREKLKKEYSDTKLIKERKNISLSLIIVGITFLVIGLIFIPIGIIEDKGDKYFSFISLEAFIVYIGCLVGLISIIVGTILLIINFKNNKINQENINIIQERIDEINKGTTL